VWLIAMFASIPSRDRDGAEESFGDEPFVIG